jgi:hypothetical protein
MRASSHWINIKIFDLLNADEDEPAANSRSMGGAAPNGEPVEVVVAKEGDEGHKKEKSVLQAKLTKLAIQIGYAGRALVKIATSERSHSLETPSFRFYNCCANSGAPGDSVLCTNICY